VHGERLRRLRQARGLTRDQLIDATGGILTNPALSRYERGASAASPRVLAAMALALGVSVAELTSEPVADVQIGVALELEHRVELQQVIGQPSGRGLPIGAFPIRTMDDVESAAEALRDCWGLGRGPLGQMVDVLDDHRFHVIVVEASQDFDGMSAIAETAGEPAAAALVSRAGVCREHQRLNLGCELSHLVTLPRSEIDTKKAAFRFATAFLAPRDSVLRTVGARRSEVSSPELFTLKRWFGIGLSALIYRLRDLDIVSSRYCQDWSRYVRQMGWRKTEPEATVAEESGWLRQMTLRALSEGLITEAHARTLLGRPLPLLGGPPRRRALATLRKEERAAALVTPAESRDKQVRE
jgi:transcriptional regulator with XRE-family HTH domain